MYTKKKFFKIVSFTIVYLSTLFFSFIIITNAQSKIFKIEDIEISEPFNTSFNKEKVIAYCGAGIAATNLAFAITMTGFRNITVYDASLNEWAKDNRLPLEI